MRMKHLFVLAFAVALGTQALAQSQDPVKPVVGAVPMAEETYTPEPTSRLYAASDPVRDKAALVQLNAELEREPYILPGKQGAPTQAYVLQIAARRSRSAVEALDPNDLALYSRSVPWTPQFDGVHIDAGRAKQYSLYVSTATNYYNRPYFVLALASAAFALDPGSTANANNFAAAIITAGERLNPGTGNAEALAPYRKEAESVFLYAMALSMTNNAWTDKSLTAILNLGNLYIDMGRLNEARSLFEVARRISPYSWDAALGMAAYFHAVDQPEKARIILSDAALDRPAYYAAMRKSQAALQATDRYGDLPLESPDQAYEEGIKAMAAQPILTAADFVAQLDQNERNRMRYFVEHLPPQGSFRAPSIKTLTEYSTLQAASSPRGVSALKDFSEMLGRFSLSSVATAENQQLQWLDRMGLKIDPGVDVDDLAKHPEKYAGRDKEPEVKISGMETFVANMDKLAKLAAQAEGDLDVGKISSSMNVASRIDPYFTILQMDPYRYADPMDILIQKHNFTVHNRKTNLYRGYLYSVNKRTYASVLDVIAQTERKSDALAAMRKSEIEKFDAEKEAARKQGADTESAEWKLKLHQIHVKYAEQLNAVEETGFGSAANIAAAAYTQKIAPTAEAYYYDVIRHVALISDPDVRRQKEIFLRTSVTSALSRGLTSVLVAYDSFHYHHEWDCDCDIAQLLRQREAEEKALHREENARVLRNKAAKKVFDSGEIPESTPLFKRLDSFGTDFNFVLVKGRVSCARTVVEFKVPLPILGKTEFFGSMVKSEFTGAATYGGGARITVGTEGTLTNGSGSKSVDVKANAFLELGGSVSVDGKGVVRDYSVTAATGLEVEAEGNKITVGGRLTFGPAGNGNEGGQGASDRDVEIKDSGFSAGITRSFGDQLKEEAGASFEASTKRGCTLSGKVEGSLEPASKSLEDTESETYGGAGKLLQLEDLYKRELWSGKYWIPKPYSDRPEGAGDR